MAKSTKQQTIELLEGNNRELSNTLSFVQERLSELEVAAENVGWDKLNTGGDKWDFSRPFLDRMISFARLMFLSNPLIGRAVWVQTFYVWALGWSVDSKDKKIKALVKGYVNDPRNKALFSQASLFDMENTRQVTGNLFLVHFTNKLTGVVRTRRVDFEEITDVVYNPNDRTEPWYYVRTMLNSNNRQEYVVYPDISYTPLKQVVDPISAAILPPGAKIQWSNPMSSYKTGGFGLMKFGVPEVYAALSWATAYKNFLEDWATLMKAYARIAMQMSGNKKSDIPGAKSKLEVGRSGNVANNTAPGGFMVSSGGVELKAVKTAGATTSAEEGYSIKLMVAAAVGLPGTFFGDADVGNFATSATLDRPTELKMVARQGLWKADLEAVFDYVILQSVIAPNGELASKGYTCVEDVDKQEGLIYYRVYAPDAKEEDDDIRESVHVSFPSILERNVTERVRGVIGALTLNGNLPTDVLPNREFMAQMLLESLGLDPEVVREELSKMFPPGSTVPPIPPPPAPAGPFGGSDTSGGSKPKPPNKGRTGPAGGSK